MSSLKRLVLLVCLGSSALAHAQGEGGAYVGAGFGTFDYDEGDDPFAISDSTSAYQIFGGYRFNDHLAVELGIGRTGDIETSLDAALIGLGTVTLDFDIAHDIYAGKVLGVLPFERFSLFGGVGYFSADVSGTVNARGFGEVGFFDAHQRGSTASLGLQYDFGLDLRNLSIRGEYQWFDFDEVDVWGVNVGMLFRF